MGIWDEFKGVSGEAWKPVEIGDHVKGKVVSVTVVESQMNPGQKHPAVSLTTEEGEDVVVYGSQAQLRRKLAEQEPSVGDTLVVVYTGTEKTRNGHDMKVFDVAVTRGAGAGETSAGGEAKATVSAADLA